MRPYKVLLFIVCVMACLAGLCFVLPGRVSLSDKDLRWPTLAEVMGAPKTADFLEKATWTLIAVIVFLSIMAVGYTKKNYAKKSEVTEQTLPKQDGISKSQNSGDNQNSDKSGAENEQ